jgi:hypothetical protein
MEWGIEDWGKGGVFNLGIYNCRTVRGSTQRSVHGDGRACDFGFPLVDNDANPAGWDLVRLLLPVVGSLGIQQIIWDRRVWSAAHPNGAHYTGVSPHIDHVHVELTREAGQILTRAHIKATIAITTDRPPVAGEEEDDDMATFIRLNVRTGKHAGRVEAVTSMHRRWVPADELQLYSFLGGKVIDCTPKQFNAWTSNKVPLGTNGITGPI